jgi:hypothetical protein
MFGAVPTTTPAGREAIQIGGDSAHRQLAR